MYAPMAATAFLMIPHKPLSAAKTDFLAQRTTAATHLLVALDKENENSDTSKEPF